MSVRHWLAGLLGVTIALRGVCCLAEDRLMEATLGPAEPIGSLQLTLVILDSPESEAQLGQPVLLAALDASTDFLRTVVSDEGEIQQQLQRTSELLGSAGLIDDALAVESILRNFESKHRDRLALTRKRAELARLQGEIAQLASRLQDGVEESQVVLSLQVFEAEANVATNLPQTCDIQEFLAWMNKQKETKSVNVLSMPQLRTISGQTAEIFSGKAFAGPEQAESDPEVRLGFSFSATPIIIDHNRSRIAMHAELAVGSENQVVDTPGSSKTSVRRSKMHSTIELDLGRTQIMKLPQVGDEKVTCFAISVTSIIPAESSIDADHSNRDESTVTPARFSGSTRRSRK